MIQAARNALELWAFQLVPSLLPFMILTSILTSFLDRCVSINPKYLIIFLGNICGYPIGAKLTADYYHKKILTRKEADFVLSLCNQSSPAFLEFYIGTYALSGQIPGYTLLILFYTSTILTAAVTGKIYSCKNIKKHSTNINKYQTNAKTNWFHILDSSISDSCKTIIIVGGYVLLFSIFMNILSYLFRPFDQIGRLIVSTIEITNGLSILKSYFSDYQMYNYFVLALTGFGGFCTMAQIKGMLIGTSLSLKSYIIGKTIYTTILLILYFLFEVFSFCF